MEDPPLIVNVPAEVRAPVPAYVPDGVIVMFPPLVVVWAPLTVRFPPMMFRFPGTELVPETVTALVLPVFPRVKSLFPTKDQVALKFGSALKILAVGLTVA
jgi:hypothetical protein